MPDAALVDRLFHEELDALDRFSRERQRRGLLEIGADDPDVRRLVEAMAFFSAQTRAAAAEAAQAAVVRMAGGTLDDLLSPMPAAAMVRAVPDGRLADAATLDEGALLRFQFTDPAYTGAPQPAAIGLGSPTPAGERVGFFTTLRRVVVRPIAVDGTTLAGARRSLQIEVRLTSSVPQKGAVSLDFFLRRPGGYASALGLQVALQGHASAPLALFDGAADGVPCAVQYGARAPASPADDGDGRGPLARLRSFFHFPDQDLYVCVDVPPAAQPWKKLTLRFPLDAGWPEDQGVSTDSFQLHVVPAVNTWFDFTAPILYDGTRSTVPLVNAAVTRQAVEPWRVRGVYQSDRAMAPLLPFALGNTGDGFEVLRPPGDAPLRLRLRLSDAVDKPRKLVADVLWSQPSLFRTSPGAIQVAPQQRAIPGVSFEIVGSVRHPEPSTLSLDPTRCLDVMALRMRPVLDRAGVAGIMTVLGASGDSAYDGYPDRIGALSASDAPDPVLRSGGVKHVYDVSIQPPSHQDPRSVRFGEKIAALLDAWTQDAVDVRVTTDGGSP